MPPIRLAWTLPALLAPTLLALAACTPPPENVATLPADARSFAGQSCERLAAEKTRLASEFNIHADSQNTNANVDAGMVAGGALLAWPMLIGLAFTKSHADDMGRLHSQFDGAAATARAQGCVPAPPEPPVAQGGDPAQCGTVAGGSGTAQTRAMTARNGGAWCADTISARGSDGKRTLFNQTVIIELPRYGDVEVVALADKSGHAVLYRPNPGFAGSDTFAVAGRAQVDAAVRYRYTVSVAPP